MNTHKVLNDEEISQALSELGGWYVKEGQICAEFTFATFNDAIRFINKVASLAEEMNHHPEFCNSYNMVSFAYCTHDVDNKITDTDIKIALQINEAAKELQN